MTKYKGVTAILLLAGLGSRLGKPIPKCLNTLQGNETILSRQIRILRSFDISIIGVIGFKKDLVIEAANNILFAYNPRYDTTNTSKSLLCALKQVKGHNVLWINGDVVFEEGVIEAIVTSKQSAVAVNNARVGEEEIKYTINSKGCINAISKTVKNALGEALGINYIVDKDIPEFIQKLELVDDNDYFERAMELLIEQQPDTFLPVDVSEFACIEVDFNEDLEKAISIVREMD